MLSQLAIFLLFYGWILFLCLCVSRCVCIYIYIIFSLSFHVPMSLYSVSMSWLLWTMLQWSGGTDSYSGWWFDVFWVYTQKLNCWIMWYFSLEEEMATHSSIFAWKIPWTEKPSGLQSMGHKDLDTTEAWSDTSIFFKKCADYFLFDYTCLHSQQMYTKISFLLSTSTTPLVIASVFDSSHANKCEVIY